MVLIYGDGARRRRGLQARREIWRLTDNRLLLRSTAGRPDQITDNNQAGSDADPALQRCRGRKRCDGRDEFQRRQHRPLRIILVGLRITEIHEHPVAHVLRYKAAKALDGLSHALLIGGNDFTEVFRIHARRERRGTDQVREHHRDLAALGGVLRAVSRRRGSFGRRCFRRLGAQQRNGIEKLPAVPDSADAEVLEILRR